MHFAAALFAAFVLVLLWRARARTPPGVDTTLEHIPFFGTTIFAVMQFAVTQKETLHEYGLRCAKRSGWRPFSHAQLGPVMGIVVLHPKDVKHVLKDNFAAYEKGSEFTSCFADLLGVGIFNTNGEQWKAQRRISSHLFSRRSLRDRMSSVFGAHAQHFAALLRTAVAGKDVVDIQDWLFRYTFDCINSVAFDRDVASLRGDERDLRFQRAFDSAQALTFRRLLIKPQFVWQAMRALGLGPEGRLAADLREIRDYVDSVVDEQMRRQDQGGGDGTLLSLFIEHAAAEGVPYDRSLLRDVVLNFLIAGRDTTAAALTMTIHLLSTHTEWQQQVADEAATVFAGRSQEPLTFEDVADLPVVSAVLLESMRLFPPVPLDGKLCLRADVLPSGVPVPAGCKVEYVPYVTNRHPELWGEDAEEFRPGRWLAGDRTLLPQPSEYEYPTFNAGPRLCLGRDMALLEAKIALLTLLEHFAVSPQPGFAPRPRLSITQQMCNGMLVRLSPRDAAR